MEWKSKEQDDLLKEGVEGWTKSTIPAYKFHAPPGPSRVFRAIINGRWTVATLEDED